MSSGDVVFISGATGVHSAAVNGPFDCTSERSGGYAVYMKRGDGSMCIEHRGGQWQVKSVSGKGTNSAIAHVTGSCALEACSSRVWKVRNGNSFVDQPSVKLATGADAEREVSGCCTNPPPLPTTTHAPTPPPPPPPPPLTRSLLRRALNMPQLWRVLWLTTTLGLLQCSSAAPQAPLLKVSTGISHLRRRRVWMGVLCTASAAMAACASSTLQANGKSNL